MKDCIDYAGNNFSSMKKEKNFKSKKIFLVLFLKSINGTVERTMAEMENTVHHKILNLFVIVKNDCAVKLSKLF